MADDREGATSNSPSHRYRDSISSLPDVILQHILSSFPTEFAIRTSVLSKRWRHVWSGTPSLFLLFEWPKCYKADCINKTLASYTAPKMMDFKLCALLEDNLPYLDSWIEFAMSRKVENMSLNIKLCGFNKYTIPDFFYINSSVKQLKVDSGFYDKMVPGCSVSWTALKKLSLGSCQLSDESLANILSGCPILESLRLYFCDSLTVLDLSKSLHLRTLEIYQGSMKIVAPHIHCIDLTNSQSPCTLVDVSSLTDARLDIHLCSVSETLKSGILRDMVLKLLEKMENVEKLTLGRTFLENLSLAAIHDDPFPSFKVKDLTLETVVSRYVIPGLVKVLQNSPELKKLTVHTMESPALSGNIKRHHRDNAAGFNLLHWRSKLRVFKNIFHWNLESKHVALFIGLMLETSTTLEKMVLRLEGYLDGRRFEELLEMVPRLSQKNNVSIVLIR